MNLWATRASSVEYLENYKPDRLQFLSRTFDIIDSAIDAYELLAEQDIYARVCGLTLIKAKNLAVGSYGLVLDGLGQEAGALLRPFIEYVELLTYFRMFPSTADRALKQDLPSAGQRAQAIGGKFKELRGYLNAHASHSSYSTYSLSHLMDARSLRFRKLQQFVPAVLERNVRDFSIQLHIASREAVLGLTQLNVPNLESLAEEVDDLKIFLVQAFDLEANA
jgi:hypothetical protein